MPYDCPAVKHGDCCALLRSFYPLEPLTRLTSIAVKLRSSSLSHSLKSNQSNMSDKKQTVDLGLLEEDDEFEEFPAEGKQC